MSKNLLDNGTVLTLGLVGTVAAIGAAAKRGVYGSRAMVSEGIYKGISLPAAELGERHGSEMVTVDVNTQDEDWGKPWLVTVGSGYSGHHFVVFGSSEDSALAHAIETAVVTAPGWTARPGDEHLEESLREYDGEGYATDDGSVYLGHFDSLHIRRLDNNVRPLLKRHGVSLEGDGSSNRGSRSELGLDGIGRRVRGRASTTDFHATLSSATGQVIREERFDHPWFMGSLEPYDKKVMDMAFEMLTRAPVGSIITIRGDGRSWRYKVVDMNGGYRGIRKMRDLKKSRKG